MKQASTSTIPYLCINEPDAEEKRKPREKKNRKKKRKVTGISMLVASISPEMAPFAYFVCIFITSCEKQ